MSRSEHPAARTWRGSDGELNTHIDLTAEPTAATTDVERLLDEHGRLLTAVVGLLDVGERSRRGNPSLDSEEWYAIRDYARKVLNDASS